jgi:hypothetical protein
VGADATAWISCSRRPDFYSGHRRYLGEGLAFATVVPTIDQLEQLGFIEHEKAKPHVPHPDEPGRQSCIRATQQLREADKAKRPVVYQPPEIIVLRDCEGQAMD